MPSEMAAPLQRELESTFSSQLSQLSSDDARESLLAVQRLCTTYAISAEDLFFKWEAFSMDNALLDFNPSNIDAFRQNLASVVEKVVPLPTPRNVLSTTRRGKSSFLSSIPATTPSRQSALQMPGGGIGDVSMDIDDEWSMFPGQSDPTTPTRPSAARGEANLAPTAKQSGMPIMLNKPTKQDVAQQKAKADEGYTHTPLAPMPNLSLNSHLDAQANPSVQKGKAFFSFAVDPAQWNYRYQFATKKAMGTVLDDKIEQMATILAEYYNLDGPGVFQDPSVQTQQDVYTIGRIVPHVLAPGEVRAAMERVERGDNDGLTDWLDTGVPRLSDMGVCLEVSKRIGDGDRVRLSFGMGCKVRSAPPAPGCKTGDEDDGLERTDHVSLFPGMLVGLKGRNGTGTGSNELGFVVSEVLLPPRLPAGKEEIKKLRKYQLSPKSMNGQPLKVTVAAGPFTSASDLLYEPLTALAQHVARTAPDVLVLLGPILSRKHKVLEEDPEVFAEDVVRQQFAARLRTLLASVPNLRIAIVPEADDIISSHAAFPQPALASGASTEEGMYDVHHGLFEDRRLVLLPNPCALWVNECLLGLSTADVLKDLCDEETVINIPSRQALPMSETTKDPVLRAFLHVISQRCFYPVMPSAPEDDEVPLAIDMEHMHLAEFANVTPDLLVLPSALPPAIKAALPTICLNPGRLGGRTGDRGGYFADISVTPMRDIPPDEGERADYHFADRCRIDMIRL